MKAQKQIQVEKRSRVVFFFKRCFNQSGISTLQLAVCGSVLG